MNILSTWTNPNNYKQRFKSPEQRFWEKVDTHSDNRCWEWLGCKNKKGYGLVHFDGKMVSTHRVAWIINYGDIPDDMFVLHECDNPSCVNPYHLFLGTDSDNMRDMVRKHRNPDLKGENHYNSKLSDKDVTTIRDMYATGNYTYSDIGNKFGVTKTTVMRIVKRMGWNHIP